MTNPKQPEPETIEVTEEEAATLMAELAENPEVGLAKLLERMRKKEEPRK